ncbi:response regulator transcription factor [Nocardia terpenica]|uniref:response regulator transcription factor n=1 Tax=Nocardia terpenica TaxID=455432 RepID=UPI00142D941E|nr:response regulator transcription factor [Nocardia terpenica]
MTGTSSVRRILIIDDDAAARNALKDALTMMEGYEIHQAADGASALSLLLGSDMDAIVVDVRMPGMDGIDFCRVLRETGDTTPILMLMAFSEKVDCIEGLNSGADDFLEKPYHLGELRARIRALLRRSSQGARDRPCSSERARLSEDLILDHKTRQILRQDTTAVQLTSIEYTILAVLLRNTGRVLPRDLIAERTWGGSLRNTSNAIDVYVHYLRKKLDAIGCPPVIHTVRGIGYQCRIDGKNPAD